MTIRPPGWQQANTYSAENDRLAMLPYQSMVGPGSAAQFSGTGGWDGGPGLTYSRGNFQVVQRGAGANMSVDVGAGFGVVPGNISSTQGMYTVVSDAVTNLAIATSNPSNPRIDIVICTVADAGYSGGVNNATFSVVTGTPAGSPVAPALPASSIVLAQVLVGAAVATIVTANITDRRLMQGAAGGLVQASSAFMPTYAPQGMELYQYDTGKVKIYSSGAVWEDLMQPGAWQTYAPAWTSTGTAPVIGNGSVTGRYSKVGRTCVGGVMLLLGSTSNAGTGFYNLSLPFPSATVATWQWQGTWNANLSGGAYIGVSVVGSNSSQITMYTTALPVGIVGQVSPSTFTTTSQLWVTFCYETAS